MIIIINSSPSPCPSHHSNPNNINQLPRLQCWCRVGLGMMVVMGRARGVMMSSVGMALITITIPITHTLIITTTPPCLTTLPTKSIPSLISMVRITLHLAVGIMINKTNMMTNFFSTFHLFHLNKDNLHHPQIPTISSTINLHLPQIVISTPFIPLLPPPPPRLPPTPSSSRPLSTPTSFPNGIVPC